MRYSKKRVIIGALLFFAIFLSISCASAQLNLVINAKLGSFNTDFRTITNDDSSAGYDGFDLIAPTTPNNYSRLYSNLAGNAVSIDVWPESESERTINLVYDNSPQTSGSLNLSWSFSDADFEITLIDYGTDSSYTASVASLNMKNANSYNLSSNGIRYIKLEITSNVVSDSEISSGGGGGGGGIVDECKESKICTSWNICQNLESSFNSGIVSLKEYLIFKSNCSANSWDDNLCGFQTRACQILTACSGNALPGQSQACQYSENPSCFDNIKNCHNGDCEILTDCGGACEACATCSDGIKNQGEKGIDCGEPCPNQCPARPLRDILTETKTAFYIYLIMLTFLFIVLILLIIKLTKAINMAREEGLKWYKL